MEITAQRSPADKPAPPIEDPLITDLRVAIERGRKELDDGEGLQQVELTCLFRPGVELGQLIEVYDGYRGEKWRGKIESVRHSARSGEMVTSLVVVR